MKTILTCDLRYLRETFIVLCRRVLLSEGHICFDSILQIVVDWTLLMFYDLKLQYMTHSKAINRVKARKSGCNVFSCGNWFTVVYACNNYLFSGLA